VSDDGRKQAVTSYVTVFEEGEEVGQMYPARWFFRGHEGEPTTEVAIRRSLGEDLYLFMANYEIETQTVHFQMYVNPLVNLVWLGFGVLAFGTGIALLPDRAFSYATSRLPADAATAAPMLLLAGVLALGTPVFAQEVEQEDHQHVDLGPSSLLVPDSDLEQDLQQSIICMCGTCGRKLLSDCTCSVAADMRRELRGLVDQGLSHDEVIEFYVAKYGSQEPLAAPIDRGFNRLAWLFPYIIGMVGLAFAGSVAVRWSRRASTGADLVAPVAPDPALEARLDDELNNLD
jgi:cytochrome c-type biogenesis protein CcmH/NrfF